MAYFVEGEQMWNMELGSISERGDGIDKNYVIIGVFFLLAINGNAEVLEFVNGV